MIHPTAVVSSKSHISQNVKIGPYCIIEDNVTIGSGTIVKPYVQIKSNTKGT